MHVDVLSSGGSRIIKREAPLQHRCTAKPYLHSCMGTEIFIRHPRLMCGTHDDSDESTKLIVTNLCTVHQLS